MDVRLSAADEDAARAALAAMCEKLLANTVIEDFAVEAITQVEPAAS